MDDLIAEFLTETNEALADLDLALVKLERTPDDQATLSLIFRLVHTIKGTCGSLGLPRLERVAHAAENVLGLVRDRELTATPAVITAVLTSLDRIKLILFALAANGAEPTGDDAACIAALEHAATGEPAPPPEPVAPADPPPGDAAAGTQTIRVSVDVLEELMTLVGELVLTRNQLLEISRAEGTNLFTAPLQRLSSITTDLQEGVMKTRMQPIGNAWNKLPRLVRDLAHETGKKIKLDMQGQDTELDRQVLELMRDPLTHMVRNSADHGLETPAVRRAAGKSETGTIRLNAHHEGGHIIIEVADDGRGLDVVAIRAKVLRSGLATETELAAMTEAQVRNFIFRAGFSTAEAVTAISGRGVGMDVVRSNIERIGGTIDLASTQGQGSCFTIKIPLTLAIVSALIVKACSERFAIPQISVLELVRVGGGTAAAIERIGGVPVLRLRNQLLPLISLGALLSLQEAEAKPASSTVVVTAVGSFMLGIVADDVYDTEEIVVKPVAPVLRHVTMVQRQHHPRRRRGDHDPGPQQCRARCRAFHHARPQGFGIAHRPGGAIGGRHRVAAVPRRRPAGAARRAAQPGGPPGGYPARQDRVQRRRRGYPIPRQADEADRDGGSHGGTKCRGRHAAGAGIHRGRTQHGFDGR